MKKHLSVLALTVYRTLFWVLAVCMVAALAQIGLCAFQILQAGSQERASYTLEQLIELPSFGRIGGIAFLAVCAVLCFCGCDRATSRSGYTMRRLQIDERAAVGWASVSNAGMLALLWGSQLAASLAVNLILRRVIGSQPDAQTLLIAFYRSEYLHALLPMREFSLLIRNLLLLLALAVSCAIFSYHQRRGGYRLEPLILVLLTLFYFPQQAGSLDADLVLMLAAVAGIISSLYSLWGGAKDEMSS